MRVQAAPYECLQDKDSYVRELEGLVKDYEALAAEKDALEQQTSEHGGRTMQLSAELEQAQLAVQQLQQVSVGPLQAYRVTQPSSRVLALFLAAGHKRLLS